MKTGRLLLIVVLLFVLAIPQIASSDLGNTVVEFSAISIINSKGEVEIYLVSAAYFEMLAIKPDEIVLASPLSMSERSHKSAIKTDIKLEGKHSHCKGGGRRVKLGRH